MSVQAILCAQCRSAHPDYATVRFTKSAQPRPVCDADAGGCPEGGGRRCAGCTCRHVERRVARCSCACHRSAA